jgi:CTP synthase (UTP-ammonia lyase)
LAQRRKANRKYQASPEAKLDHADRQRAYCQRQLKKVTGQGSETATFSATIDSALISTGFGTKNPEQQARQAPYAESNPFPVCQKAGSRLVSCIVCRRSVLWTAPLPRSP